MPFAIAATILAPIALSQRPPATWLAIPTAEAAPRWQSRSEHFVYGMPEPTDDRHQTVGKDGRPIPDISVLRREGAVIGHYDKMKVPAWVVQRWTAGEFVASKAETYNERRFAADHELPSHARAGTGYDFKTS